MERTRRGILRKVAVGGLIGLSGCLWLSDTEEWDTVSPQPFTEVAGSLTPTARFGGTGFSKTYGYSVATTGEEVFVGSHIATFDGVTDAGCVYVFRRIDGQWQQVTVLTGRGNEGELFGRQVAAGGSTLLVRYGMDLPKISKAPVTVFERSKDGRWRQTATIGDDGYSGSMATDGNTAVITTEKDESVQVYETARWDDPMTLEKSEPASGRIVNSVGVDGQTILVGTPPAGGPKSQRAKKGAVHVFERSDDGWSKQTTLTGPPGEDDFGTSVAIAGETALIGDRTNNSAHVFTRTGGSWAHKQMYTATVDGHSQSFGHTVAMDSGTYLVGAPHARAGGTVYSITPPNGAPEGTYYTGPGTSGLFGYRVATADGTTVIAGGPSATELRVYIYDL